MGRSRDNEVARVGPLGSQNLDEREPVQAGHAQIGGDHFVGPLAGHRDRVPATVRSVHSVAEGACSVGEGLPGGRVIVDIKDMSFGVLGGSGLSYQLFVLELGHGLRGSGADGERTFHTGLSADECETFSDFCSELETVPW